MNKLINDINTSLKNKESKKEDVITSEHESAMKRYENLRNSKETLELRFDTSDTEGTLCTFDDAGVKLVLPREDQKLGRYQQRTGSLVGVNLIVNVKSVSRKDNKVVFAMAEKRSTVNTDIRAELDKDLKRGNHPRLFGRVIRIAETRDYRKSEAWVRLLDREIPATLNIREYSKTYTNSLYEHLRIGEIYEFDVIGSRRMKKRGGQSIYELSRKEITPDPWQFIPLDLKENDVILVKCIGKPEDKQYWWGSNPNIKGLSIMGLYNKDISVVVGGYYKCYVKRLDTEAKIFKVLPFQFYPISEAGVNTIKNVATEINLENKREK